MSYYFALHLFEDLVIDAWRRSIFLGLIEENLSTWLYADKFVIFLFILSSFNDLLVFILFSMVLLVLIHLVAN